MAGYHPLGVVEAAVTAGCLTVVVGRPEVGLIVLMATLPLETTLGGQQTGGLLTPSKIAGGLAFVGFVANALLTRRRLTGDPGYAVLMALGALFLVSAATSLDPSNSAIGVLRLVSFLGLYVLVTQLGNATLLRRAVWALTLGSGVAAAVSLATFGTTLIARPNSGDPNDFAFLLSAVLPLTLWLASRQRGAARLLAGGAAATVTVCVPLTLSRGALVGLAVGTTWHLLTSRRHRLFLVSALTCLACVAAALSLSAPRSLQEAVSRKETVSSYNVSSRQQAWEVALRLAAANPVTGVGPGNFDLYYRKLTDTPAQAFGLAVSHNTYLDLAAESGPAGLLLLLLLLGASMSRLNAAVRERRGPPGLAEVVRTSLIIASCAAVFSSQEYAAPLWLLFAFASLLAREQPCASCM